MYIVCIHVCICPSLSEGDVAGSVEALIGVLKAHPPEKLDLKVVHSGVGQITDSDVELAASLNGKHVVIGGDYYLNCCALIVFYY